MTRKKLYTTALSAVTLILAVIFFIAGSRFDASKIAGKKLSAETEELNKSTEALKDSKKDLREKISDIEEQLSSKKTINDYFINYKRENDTLTESVESLKKQSAELDTSIEEKRFALSSASVTKEKRGKSYTLEKDKAYTCPDSLPKGRYFATGDGLLNIYTSAGKLRDSQNLTTAHNNSYIFELDEDEKVVSKGDIKITELISED